MHKWIKLENDKQGDGKIKNLINEVGLSKVPGKSNKNCQISQKVGEVDHQNVHKFIKKWGDKIGSCEFFVKKKRKWVGTIIWY